MAQDGEKVAYVFEDPGFGVRADNAYLLADGAMFAMLCEIVDRNRSSYSRILSHSAKDVGEWLDAVLAPLVAKYQDVKPGWRMPTRNKIWHVLHGVTEPFRCPTCGKVVFKSVHGIFWTGTMHCSNRCAGLDHESQRKFMETKAAKYGDPFFNNRPKFRETMESMSAERRGAQLDAFRKTCRDRYGADSYMATSDFREKAAEWVRNTYGGQYDNVLQVPQVRHANEEKNLAEHGHPKWSNWEKGRETCMRNHGVDVIFKSREFRESMFSRRDEICGKRRDTCMERYGMPFKPTAKYEYGGETFDSRPELAFYVWAKDRNMDVSRNRSLMFGFDFDGRRRVYWPDFLLDGKPVEIKGDQFFRKDGTMYCPYRHPGQTDAQYERECAIYEAKRQCMLANGVRVVRTAEYSEYMKYVEETYGVDFFDKHRKPPPAE